MINIDYLRNGGSLISQTYINNNKKLEIKIKKNLGQRRIEYLKMSNALKDLINYKSLKLSKNK